MKRSGPDVFALKRKLVATMTGPVPVPPDVLPVTDELSTEYYRPRTVAAICGNSRAKQKMETWMQSGGKTLCCLSGPVGCGKTSLAHAVMAGREVVDLRQSEDMFTILTDMMTSTHRKPAGVVIDEIENLSAPVRSKILNILTRNNRSVPVICICTDPSERAVKTFVRTCGTHVQMEKPSATIAADVVRLVAPRISSGERDRIARASNGDLRQATILAHMARVEKHVQDKHVKVNPPDRRISNIFCAAQMAFGLSVHNVVDALQFDTLVPLMAQAALAARMYVAPGNKKEDVQQQAMQLDELSDRLDAMCDGDIMDTCHQTHNYAPYRYAEGVVGMKTRRGAPTPTIPKTLSLAARRRASREVMLKFGGPFQVQVLKMKLDPKADKAVLKQLNLIKF